MSLPKIKYPIFELTLPSDKTKLTFRPFTVKEEKLLLIAQESEATADRLRAIRQIVNNCMLDLPKDIGLMPAFDLEYCFLKIRAKSVGNDVELRYRDNTDGKIYEFVVDLDALEVTFSDDHNPVIKFDDTLGVIMQYPTIEILNAIDGSELEDTEATLVLVKKCITTIYDEETTYDTADYTDGELNDFIEALPGKHFQKISQFFETMPILKHDLNYKDTAGTEKTITLQGIDDFFQ